MGHIDLAREFCERVIDEFRFPVAAGLVYGELEFCMGMVDVLYPASWDATTDSTMKSLGQAFNVCSNLLVNVAQQLWGPDADKRVSKILHDVADRSLMKLATQRGPAN